MHAVLRERRQLPIGKRSPAEAGDGLFHGVLEAVDARHARRGARQLLHARKRCYEPIACALPAAASPMHEVAAL